VQPVLWEQTMRELLAAGFDRFGEIGPGRVLAGLPEARSAQGRVRQRRSRLSRRICNSLPPASIAE
jgi:malonyl CoA-acyl carrier protein transacylase